MGKVPLKKLLLFVDSTEEALLAARYAIVLAKAYGSELYALYVVNEKVVDELFHARIFLREEGLEMRQDLEQDGRRYLTFIEKLAATKGVPVTTELRTGVVHREVVEYAEKLGAGAIVVGGIQEPGSRRECFYEETERIVWVAPCPVLVVRGEDTVQNMYDTL